MNVKELMNMDRWICQGDNIEFEVIQFNTFGKDMIRQLNLHPDTFVQMAVQYAYYRIYRKYVPPCRDVALIQKLARYIACCRIL